ncbi:MAG: hypothetical protein LBM04_07685 [Opitutaceae bacterium]|jgi:hypothetical protein|nr:hypothetical protein [Opitutaceae bacterium]
MDLMASGVRPEQFKVMPLMLRGRRILQGLTQGQAAESCRLRVRVTSDCILKTHCRKRYWRFPFGKEIDPGRSPEKTGKATSLQVNKIEVK